MTRDRNLLLVFALLIAGLGWYWLASSEAAPPPAEPGTTVSGPAPSAAAGGTHAAPKRDPERTAVATQTAQPTDDTALATVLLRGRCVRAGDGEPITGCTAGLRIEAGPAAKVRPWGEDDLAVRATTTIDGTFELTTHYDTWTDTIALRLTASGYVPRVGRWPRPQPGSEIDLGDVPMLPAILVTGLVVDEQGAPIADASMMFVYIELTGGHEVAAENILRARSDQAGRFSFPLPAFPGEWYIGAEDTGALVEPRSVKLSAEQSPFLLRVVVERPDAQHSITGIVVDTANQPLAGVRVTATGEGFIGRGRSGTDGRFTVQRAGPVRDDGKPGTLLSCGDPDRLYERTMRSAANASPGVQTASKSSCVGWRHGQCACSAPAGNR